MFVPAGVGIVVYLGTLRESALPLAGGLWASWLTGLAVGQFRPMPILEPGLPPHVTVNFSIVAGACVIIVLGLWDDVLGVPPWAKIGGQVAAAADAFRQPVEAIQACPVPSSGMTPVASISVRVWIGIHQMLGMPG